MNWLWQQSDKRGHFLAGLLIGFIVSGGAHWFYDNDGWDALFGLFAATMAGHIKELRDSKDLEHHTPDYKDAFATTLGGVVGALIPSLIYIDWTLFL